MTTVRHIDCEYDNARMTSAGFEIIAIESHHWADGHSETEILWGREEHQITVDDLPF